MDLSSEDNPHAWHASTNNFLPRVGVNYRLSDDSVARFAYARYMMPTINVRDTLGDFVNQYDRFNLSYQKQVWWGTTVDLSYFYNLGTRVSYNINLNMADPSFRYEQRTLLNTQVDNPFFGYLTPDKFPGSLRNNRQVTLTRISTSPARTSAR